MGDPKQHSPLGASSAYRWMMCPASCRLSEGMPSTSSEFAVAGTAAHALCELCLTSPDHDPFSRVGETIEHEAGTTEVTEDMATAAKVYVDTVLGDLEREGGTLSVEQPFDLSWIHESMFGRNDAAILPAAPCGTLYIYDYKNGSKPVRAERNPQCMYYALGALGKDNPTAAETVRITIVQPNSAFKSQAVDRWEVGVDELYKWAEEELRPAALRTLDADAPSNAGEWCQFCPALAVCPAKRDLALERMDSYDDNGECPRLPAVERLKPAEVGFLSAFFGSQDFAAWLKAVQAEELRLLQEGVEIPGRRLAEERSLGNRKWRDETEAAEALAILGPDRYVRSLVSPAVAEKMLKARGMKKREIDGCLADVVTREAKTKTVVVGDDDPRLAFTAARDADVRAQFAPVEN